MYAVSDSRGVPKDDLLGQAGWAAMRGAPGAWALNALTHYWGLWTAYWVYRPDFIASYEAYTQNLEESDLFAEARVFQPLPPAGLRIRLIMLAGLAVSLIAIGLAVRQFLLSPRPLDGRLAVASLSGLAVHGHFLLIGLTGVATPRYALVMLPVLALCGFLLVNWVVEQAWSRMEKQHPHPRQCELRRTGVTVGLPRRCPACALPQRREDHSGSAARRPPCAPLRLLRSERARTLAPRRPLRYTPSHAKRIR